LAADYDRLVGDALYPTVRASFDACVRTLGLRFGSLADVGCGTGRFLRDMLRYGVPLLGVDRSPQMLRIAARRLRDEGVLLMNQDMRRLRLPRPVERDCRTPAAWIKIVLRCAPRRRGSIRDTEPIRKAGA
jgi:ubiquinone/menaquinone biosynthesis C-methylase UbiE